MDISLKQTEKEYTELLKGEIETITALHLLGVFTLDDLIFMLASAAKSMDLALDGGKITTSDGMLIAGEENTKAFIEKYG